MSVVSYALTTKTKVKTYLGITGTDYDTFFDEAINYVTDFIENYCGGRRFLRGTISNETYDTNNQYKIFLKNFPVTSLTTVEYRSGTIASPTWITFDANGYLLYGNEGYVKFFSKLPKVAQGMRFTYVAGYLIDFANEGNTTLHTLPYDLTMVATEMVAKIYQTRQAQGIQSMSTEGQSISFKNESGLSSVHKEVLSNYSKHSFMV